MSASKAFHEEFAARVIAMLENGTAPWQKPWTPAKELAPYNPISGVTYRGGNRLWLSMLSTGDPRWMTFKQAVKAGYKIRKGSKSVPIEYFVTQVTEDRLDENGRPVLDEDGNPERVTRRLERPMLKIHRVFNAQDVEGLPPLEVSKPLYEWEPLEKAEEILSRSGAVIKHDQADRAFYSIARDEIHLPPRSNFDAPDKYYATALHELGHWTGHESRMDRPFGVRGSEGYAKEELRAEIASWMLGQDIGVGHDPGQHAAYVQSWIADLKDDPLEILRACRDAEHIKEYLMGLEREHTLQTEREADNEKGRRSAVQDRGVPDVGREPSRAAPALEKTWLAVPYSARREAKALGAKWDAREKQWYCPEGGDLASLQKFMPGEKAPAPEKTWLSVPYREKNDAKSLGAKFDWNEKRWFAPEGVDLGPLQRWLPAVEQARQEHLDPAQEFAVKLAELGLDLKGQLPVMDGQIHRVPLLAKNGRGLDGAYCLHADGIPAGWAQNHVQGDRVTLIASGVRLSPAEMEKQRAERAARIQAQQQARALEYDNAAARAQRLWDSFGPAGDHAYLQEKGVEAFGIRQVEVEAGKSRLVVPLHNIDGELRGYQTIDDDGQKRFFAGMEKRGNFCLLGDEGKDLSQAEIVICEGYATGASIHMATGAPVAVAFDAGNLKPVAEAIREKYPNATITICADNDHGKEQETGRNVGVEAARDAARAVQGKVRIPIFTADEKQQGLTDFNDLHKARGLDAVRRQLGRAQEKGVER